MMINFIKQRFNCTVLLFAFGFLCFIFGCKTQKEISKPAEEGQTTTTNAGSHLSGSDNVLKDAADSPKNFIDSILSGYVVHRGTYDNYYTYKIIDSIPYILQKVFPGVQFVKCTVGTSHPYDIYTMIYNGELFGSFGGFNKLTTAVGTTKMDFQDKALALILLFEGIEKSVRIEEIIADPQYSSKINCHPNYKIRAFVDDREVFYYLEEIDGKFVNLATQRGIAYSICMQFI